jgi:hypothetical protein
MSQPLDLGGASIESLVSDETEGDEDDGKNWRSSSSFESSQIELGIS